MNVHCDQILAGKDDSFITRHDSFVSITSKVYACCNWSEQADQVVTGIISMQVERPPPQESGKQSHQHYTNAYHHHGLQSQCGSGNLRRPASQFFLGCSQIHMIHLKLVIHPLYIQTIHATPWRYNVFTCDKLTFSLTAYLLACMSKTKLLNIRIEPDLKKKAKKLAEADGRSLSNWVTKLIASKVKEAEKEQQSKGS
jgi:hypothetical protein